MYFRRIGELRIDHDIKQTQIADALNIAQSTYSGYESGKINIPIEMLIKMADYYQVSLDYLVGRSNEK